MDSGLPLRWEAQVTPLHIHHKPTLDVMHLGHCFFTLDCSYLELKVSDCSQFLSH